MVSPRRQAFVFPLVCSSQQVAGTSPCPVHIYRVMNVSEGPRNTGPHTSDGRAGHSPVNKNVNRFKEFRSHVDQWFITFETLVELFGLFLPEEYNMPVTFYKLLLEGFCSICWDPREKLFGGVTVDSGRA